MARLCRPGCHRRPQRSALSMEKDIDNGEVSALPRLSILRRRYCSMPARRRVSALRLAR